MPWWDGTGRARRAGRTAPRRTHYVEWARAGGRLSVLQARPITTLRETWNDSLATDFLWTSTNVGEALPDVMTPCTWSMVQIARCELFGLLKLRSSDGQLWH